MTGEAEAGGAGTTRPVVWTVAGFDPSSGAGVTADLLTFAAHGLFGCAAITAYTVQSTLGVAAVQAVEAGFLSQVLAHLCADLMPFGVKIGMLASSENAQAVASFLERLRGPGERERPAPIVLDPVLRSSSGRELYPARDLQAVRELLLSQVDWVTPNWGELEMLANRPPGSIRSIEEAGSAAQRLIESYPGLNVVVTGGDQPVPTEVVVTADGQQRVIAGEHVATRATHGTGCAFSSALLAHLVRGEFAEQAVKGAKAYVAGALRHAPGLGHGRGPLDLLWELERPPQGSSSSGPRGGC